MGDRAIAQETSQIQNSSQTILKRKASKKERQTIFIHSAGWRTGSTYLWSKFRKLSNTVAFYEPFNHLLAHTKKEEVAKWVVPRGHPKNIDKPYFEEFINFIEKEGGVELFKEEMPYNNFFENDDLKNKDVEYYLKNLIQKTDLNKIVVFAFNRSAGRLPWMKRNFPSSLHILQFRNPKDQWVSIKNANILATTDGLGYESLIYYLNKDSEVFKPLQNIELKFQNKDELNYFFFLYLHYYFMNTGIKYCDLIIDMNACSISAEKKKELQRNIMTSTGLDIDFTDMSIKEYPPGTRDNFCYPHIDNLVDKLIEG
jgi:hypothetical protein